MVLHYKLMKSVQILALAQGKLLPRLPPLLWVTSIYGQQYLSLKPSTSVTEKVKFSSISTLLLNYLLCVSLPKCPRVDHSLCSWHVIFSVFLQAFLSRCHSAQPCIRCLQGGGCDVLHTQTRRDPLLKGPCYLEFLSSELPYFFIKVLGS